MRNASCCSRVSAASFAAVTILVAGISTGRSAAAQAYPSRPITIIAPFPAGGPSDSLVRALSEHLRTTLGQAIIIENVSGASGSLGTGRVARAAPDGYTLGIGGYVPHVINPIVLSVPYDPLKDFSPIAPIATSAHLIAARKTMPADDLKGLIAWLKANPDKATNGTSGVASAIHLAGIFFQRETGTRFAFVPYRGSVPAMQDLVAGQIDFMIDVASGSLAHVRAGNIKAYAVTKRTRIQGAPEIPTVDEAGLLGFHMSSWFALYAPKATPRDVITKLNAAVIAALADPAVRKRLDDLGQEIFAPEQQTPEALIAFQKAEIDKWSPIIQAAGLKAE